MSDPNEWNNKLIAEFRANGGKVGERIMLLLGTIGAKSGMPRVNPLNYVMDGERFVVIASNEGQENNPDWYHNVAANPLVTLEVGAEEFQARATIAEEPERTRLFDLMVAAKPEYAEYQKSTTRKLPAIALTRVK